MDTSFGILLAKNQAIHNKTSVSENHSLKTGANISEKSIFSGDNINSAKAQNSGGARDTSSIVDKYMQTVRAEKNEDYSAYMNNDYDVMGLQFNNKAGCSEYNNKSTFDFLKSDDCTKNNSYNFDTSKHDRKLYGEEKTLPISSSFKKFATTCKTSDLMKMEVGNYGKVYKDT